MDFKTYITEMPQVSVKSLNPEYLEQELIVPIKKAIRENSFFKTKNKEIALVPLNKFEHIFVYIKNEEVIGAVRTKIIEIKDTRTPAYQITLTKKFSTNYKNFMSTMYNNIMEHTGSPIFSDNLQTLPSSTIWKKWFRKNKLIVLENYTTVYDKTEEDIWSSSEDRRKYIVGSDEKLK